MSKPKVVIKNHAKRDLSFEGHTIKFDEKGEAEVDRDLAVRMAASIRTVRIVRDLETDTKMNVGGGMPDDVANKLNRKVTGKTATTVASDKERPSPV